MAEETTFVSPGIFSSENDLSFVTSSIGVTSLGITGEFRKGPAFSPVAISSYDEFKKRFGSLDQKVFGGVPKYEGNYIAKNYLQESNQLFVTRVLGLSGYDADRVWVIRTDAALDSTTSATTVGELSYASSGGTEGTESGIMPGGESGDSGGITQVGRATFSGSAWTFSGFTGAGSINEKQSILTTITTSNSGTTQFFSTTATTNYYDTWDKTGTTTFSGVSFSVIVTSTTVTDNNSVLSGSAHGTVTIFTGSSFDAFEDMVVATVRSRGSYDGDTLSRDVSSVTISDSSNISGSVAGDADPFGVFTLSAGTEPSTSKTYDVSLLETNRDYIIKVLGETAADKTTKIWVEEHYPELIRKLDDDGRLYGLKSTLTDAATQLNNYKTKFKTPETPFVVSEVRGNTVERLFKFISISDGDSANEQIKISIQNINLETKEFDVIIRDFTDTDIAVKPLESFTRCTMQPTLNNFVGKRIGTDNGDYTSKSKYVTLVIDENAPADSFPAGFEGYIQHNYSGNTKPELIYKQTYTTDERSSVSKLKKTFLGISEKAYDKTKKSSKIGTGIDKKHFIFQGADTWTGVTPGFHLDQGASGFTANTHTFKPGATNIRVTTDVGAGTYYEKRVSRKFTLVPAQGYDGWDIYRTSRTFSDLYKVGATGYKNEITNGLFIDTTNEEIANSDYYAYLTGIKTFDNPESVNINLFATPGINFSDQLGLVNEAISMIENDRADTLYVVTTPDATDSTTLAEDTVDLLDTSDIDSSYTATYYPWIQTRDDENGVNIFLPPTAEVVKNIALTDNVSFPWFAPAGLTRGLTKGKKTRRKLTQDDRDTLYKGRINPIATFSDVGVVIWGNKTLQVKESALDRINVRRLLLQTRKLISAIAIRLVFEQNDQELRDQFLSLVNPILDGIKQQRGLAEFKVVMDDTVNSPESIDRNELFGEIFIKPTRSAEFIVLSFNIMPSGSNFENI
ncbi:hypothetical protein COB55_04450 [Candidatus Wolfebacteria bacterium]|nr:MAG: hypothetical protein COB55_04450 [Candidatus Wolfebacteria bacterium]